MLVRIKICKSKKFIYCQNQNLQNEKIDRIKTKKNDSENSKILFYYLMTKILFKSGCLNEGSLNFDG
ncbi:MAG: hypothetical protein DRR19_07590 [Candidatus Parabeggiatoa sp. nov. 1]|nr:MAG: hypothetical protein DRR19_07590 [Gammaproteobacteria bacterium]